MSEHMFTRGAWVTFASGRSFFATRATVIRAGSTTCGFVERKSYEFEVNDETSQRYLRKWFREGKDDIADLREEHNTAGGRSTMYVLVARGVRAHPAQGAMGEHDPLEHEFLLKYGVNADELQRHIAIETVELVDSLTGPFYAWREGMTKEEARAVLRTTEALTREKADEPDLVFKTASGKLLDHFVRQIGLTRGLGESDASLRTRLQERYKR
jgi:hypothetical protein